MKLVINFASYDTPDPFFPDSSVFESMHGCWDAFIFVFHLKYRIFLGYHLSKPDLDFRFHFSL